MQSLRCSIPRTGHVRGIYALKRIIHTPKTHSRTGRPQPLGDVLAKKPRNAVMRSKNVFIGALKLFREFVISLIQIFGYVQFFIFEPF